MRFPQREYLAVAATPVVAVASALFLGSLSATLAIPSGEQLRWWAFFVPAVGIAAACVRRAVHDRRRRVRSAVLALLVLATTGVTVLRVVREHRPPAAALVAERVVAFEAVCVSDLRPSSSRSRSLPVRITAVETREGWRGNAMGIVRVAWTGEYTLATVTGERRVPPVRGDTLLVNGPFPVDAGGMVWSGDGDLTVRPSGDLLSETRRRGREAVRRRLQRLESPARDIVRALLLGDRSGLPDDTVSVMRRAGAAHVIALSGMHLAVLALLLRRLLGLALGPRTRDILVAATLVGYVWLTGWIPSLVRALVLSLAAIAAAAGDRVLPPAVTLARAVIVVTAVAPRFLLDVGFQLSLLAIGGLVWISPRCDAALRRLLPAPVAAYVGATVGAMAATAVVSLSVFGTLYPVGIVSAGILSALVVAIMWGALAFCAVATTPVLGSLLAEALRVACLGLVSLAGGAAAVPGIEVGTRGGLTAAVCWCTILGAGGAAAALRSAAHRRTVTRVLESYDKPQLDY